MPISSLRANRSRQLGQAGFSLLEVLIALTIASLAVVMTLPALGAMMERRQVHAAFAAANIYIATQRIEARLDGAVREVPAGPAAGAADRMPAGWSFVLAEPLVVFPSGACARSEIVVTSAGGRVWRRAIAPPHCRAVL